MNSSAETMVVYDRLQGTIPQSGSAGTVQHCVLTTALYTVQGTAQPCRV